MDLQLSEKTALVTGASVGIGRAIATGAGRRGRATGDLGAPRRQIAGGVRGHRRGGRQATAAAGLRPVPARRREAIGGAGHARPRAGRHPDQQRRRLAQLQGPACERRGLAGGHHAQFPPAAPTGRRADRRHGRQRLGPHRQHHRQERARAHQRRVLCQGGDAQLGQGAVAHGRQERHHGELHRAGPHPVRADPAQLQPGIPPMAVGQRDSGRAATAKRRNWPTWWSSWPRRGPATSRAP